MGLLERAHSYKDKVAQGAETNHGLFAYPVLMAADILLYNSDLVPVGKDQKQHLEIARDIAQKFNDRFGPVFKLPEPVIREATAIVPGVDGRKMSKSYGNTIPLFGEEKAIKKPVMGIKTDSTPIDRAEADRRHRPRPAHAGRRHADAYEAYVAKMRAAGVGYGDLKKELLAAIDEAFLAPFQEKYRHYQAHPGRSRSHPARWRQARARAGRCRCSNKARARHGTYPMNADSNLRPCAPTNSIDRRT